MTPIDKAMELADKYYWTFGDGYLGKQHIQCALIAVDEMIEETVIYPSLRKIYWERVKNEIEKL